MISKLQGAARKGVPPFMCLAPTMQHRPYNNGKPGFLGPAHAPFRPTAEGKEDLVLQGVTLDRLNDRRALLASFDNFRRETDASKSMEGLDAYAQQAFGILTSSDLAQALDLSKESPEVRARYGSGTPQQGEQVYLAKCVACHGEKGAGKPNDQLVGGQGSLGPGQAPVKTVGSFWPYPTTLFDFVRRAMPLNAPQSLTPDEVYAVSAYVLFLNGIVTQNMTLDADTLAKIKMPNREGFVSAYPTPSASAKP